MKKSFISLLIFLLPLFASAEAINLLKNADFSKGKAGWSNSGGTFSAVTSGSNLLYPPGAVTFDASASGQYFQSNLYTIPEGLEGEACEAQIHYKGGDTNLEISVYDESAAEVPRAPQAFPIAATNRSMVSVFFRCPESGSIRLRVEANADAALATFGKAHLGGLKNLAETTLPDIFRFQVTGTTGAIVSSAPENSGVTVTRTATGQYTVDYTSLGLTVAPIIEGTPIGTCSSAADDERFHVSSASTTSALIKIVNGASPWVDCDHYFSIYKSGADAKQSVQVYRSIPKVSENINDFYAEYYSSVLTEAGPDWVDSVTTGAAGDYTLNFNVGVFSTAPVCTAGTNSSTNTNITCISTQATTTSVGIHCQNAFSNTPTNSSWSISCRKAGSDFKMPIVQPIVQMENRYQVKFLSADITATTNPVTDLGYSGLTIGKTYRVTINAGFLCNTTSQASLEAVHDAITVAFNEQDGDGGTSSGLGGGTSSAVGIFTATTSTLTFSYTENTDCTLMGDGTRGETWVMLEELNNTEVTTAW